MSKRSILGVGAALLLALGAAVPTSGQVCAPLDDGRIADAFYEGTVIFWDPVVEFQRITLTISGPCEDIVKVFTPKDEIMFDIREIERITDGQYTWTLRREASIDPGVQQNLAEARGSGEEDRLWWSYFQAGKIPEGPYTESGAFTVDRGVIVDPGQVEKSALASKVGGRSSDLADAAIVGGVARGEAATGGNTLATRDQVIPDDLIVQGSLCVGFDCVNGEVFNADTIRLKENNLRIHFQDTSVGTFPTGDWRLEANSNASGGLSYFSIQDADSGSNIVLVEDGAPADSVRIDSTGRVGLGTANPVLDLHISSTNTPGMRLEQTSAGGFTAQTWDIAGNEANFFVRDVTGGSRLSFRIRPGAPTSSIDIAADGDVGIGTASPAEDLHVFGTDGSTQLLVQETSGTAATRTMISMQNNGGVRLAFNDMNITAANGNLTMNPNNSVNVNGDFSVTGVKNFAVIDPEDASRAYYYASLEGPEAGTYYRGRAQTVGGRVTIELPEFFSKLTEAEGMTVQLTPIGRGGQLYVLDATPGALVVEVSEGEDLGFYYLVQGVRKGYADYQVERSSIDLR